MQKLSRLISRNSLGCSLIITLFLSFQSCSEETPQNLTPIVSVDTTEQVEDTVVVEVEKPISLWDSIGPIDESTFKITYTDIIQANGTDYYKITWEDLAKVTFADLFSDEEQAYYYYPTFSAEVLPLHERNVELTGYLIPIEPEEGYYVLSANPNASCFFCGEAGQESVVAIDVDKANDEMVMDAVLTFRGEMTLNREDMYSVNYIIRDAEFVK